MARRTDTLARRRAAARRHREALARRQETIFAVALGLAGLVAMLLSLMDFDTLKFAFEGWAEESTTPVARMFQR